MTVDDDQRQTERLTVTPTGVLARSAAPEAGDTQRLRPAAPDAAESAGMGAALRLGFAAVAGLAGALLIVGTSPVWRLAPPDWRLLVPGLAHPGSSLYSGVTFVLGIGLMAAGWIATIGYARRYGLGTRGVVTVVAVTVLWSLPFVFGPPQLSNDVYAYSAQGELAANNIDPTANGPDELRGVHDRLEFWRQTDPIWRGAPAPYGPVAIGAAQAAVEVVGHDAAASIWVFRGLAVVGVVLSGLAVADIARRRGVNPAVALAVGIANPLVIVHLIGGSHNDVGMMALLLLGVAAHERGRKWAAVVLVSLAVAVKLPALLGLAFIGWNWKGRHARWSERIAPTAVVTAASGALIGVMCLVSGTGLGWLNALGGTTSITSTVSAFTKFGFMSSDVLGGLGLDVSSDATVALWRYLGLLVAATLITWLLWQSPARGVPLTLGAAMLVLVFCGPVVWPWYLPVGIALLAAGGVQRWRPTLIVLTIGACLLVFPTSVSPINELSRWQHWLGLGILLLIAAGCFAAQAVARATERHRFRHGRAPLPAADPAPAPVA